LLGAGAVGTGIRLTSPARNTMSFNLRSIRTAQTFAYPVKDQDGAPTGVVFELAGPTHPNRKNLELARSRKVIRDANKAGRVVLPDPADAEARQPQDLAAQTLGWTGYVDDAGTPVPFSQQAAEALYSDPEMAWLVDQVQEALGNKALFTKPASAS
jgi:hypothetical protein